MRTTSRPGTKPACGVHPRRSVSVRRDVFVVTKIDRLARSVADLCAIVKRIDSKGATLRILAINLDTATPTGKLMLNVLASVAQFEREVMLERQREGIAKAARVDITAGRLRPGRSRPISTG
jgi:DNA invertase Pin-like site-specific DNA recombinase